MFAEIKQIIINLKLDLYTGVCVYFLGLFLTLLKYCMNKKLAKFLEKRDAFGMSLVFWPISWITYLYLVLRHYILNDGD